MATNNLTPKYLRMLIVGEPGHGKTRLACSSSMVEDMYPVLVLSIGGNPVSIRDMPQDRITVIEYSTPQILAELGEFLDSGQKLTSAFAKKYDVTTPFKTFVIDGATEYNKRLHGVLSGLSAVGFGQIPEDVADLRDYNKLHGAMLQFAYQAFENFPMHVIMTCLEQPAVSGSKVLAPSFIGDVKNKLHQYPPLVVRVRNAGALPSAEFDAIQTAATKKVPPEVFTRNSVVCYIKANEVAPFIKNQYSLTENSLLLNPTMDKIRKTVVMF